MLRPVIILHRYLGVVVGLVMTIWCLSGFVMMYQGFPETSASEREAAQEPLDLADCCALDLIGGRDEAPAQDFGIRMRAGEPVIEVRGGDYGGTFELRTGAPVKSLLRDEVSATVDRFLVANGIEGGITSLETVEVDQWTVYMWRRAAPLWKAEIDDRAGTYVYVSGASGDVVQDASRQERIVAWLGAIPHWLYPQLLRQNQPLWYQSVIWLTVLGIFLTVTGLVVGFVRLRGRSGRWFPYRRPMWLWHHMFGVFAGVLVLTWTASGLLTMQPWGLLESAPSASRRDVTGTMNWADARALIDTARLAAGPGTISLDSAPLAGRSYLIARAGVEGRTRIGLDGVEALSVPALRAGLERKGLPVSALSILREEDAYYYGHKRRVALPVVRVILDDADRTRVYLDPETGEILRFVSATGKRYRWLENGFHNFDWPVLRRRPVWDVVVILLMAGVTLVCASGTWLAFGRVRRDAQSLFRRKPEARTRNGSVES